jgi:hypothetical protein
MRTQLRFLITAGTAHDKENSAEFKGIMEAPKREAD